MTTTLSFWDVGYQYTHTQEVLIKHSYIEPALAYFEVLKNNTIIANKTNSSSTYENGKYLKHFRYTTSII